MDSLKWKSTQIGNHHVMNINFNETEVELAMLEEDATKLQNILNAAKHAYKEAINENKNLQSQLSSQVIAPEIKKTMKVWRDQLNDFLTMDSVDDSLSPDAIYNVNYLKDEEAMLDLARAYKILGYSIDNIQLKINSTLTYLLKKNDLTWKDLASNNDADFINYCNTPIFNDKTKNISADQKDVYKIVMKFEDVISNLVLFKSVSEIAHQLDIPTGYVWAFCVASGINYFVYNNTNKTLDQYVVDAAPKYDVKELYVQYTPTMTDSYKKINHLGGLSFLKQCKKAGLSQRDVGIRESIRPAYISSYIKDHGSSWRDW